MRNPDAPVKSRPEWAIGSLSRRTRQRGMILSGTVGLLTLGLSFLGQAHAKPPVSIVVARHSLLAGTVVTAHDVTTESLPAPGLTHAVTSMTAVVGHTLVWPVGAGQPLVTADVAKTPLVQGLTPNEVAVMLPVSLASSDNVKPNDIVDVIWVGAGTTGQSHTGPSVATGTVIARGLRVLAVLNQNGGPVQPPGSTGINASTPATVEVAVPSYDAGQLAVAAADGHFWLALDPWAASATPAASSSTLRATPATPPSGTFPFGSASRSASSPAGASGASPTSAAPSSSTAGSPSASGTASPSAHG
ncbi:MAG: Flp pilus assembly protein CpaB [Thermaerobacter sp.]|nr:Flp pilus assembly protein CpaB [Thermaerobacter sp.]